MSSRDRRSRHRNSNNSDWHGKNNSNSNNRKNDNRSYQTPSPKKNQFRPVRAVNAEQIRMEEEAIRVFKNENQVVCPKCGKTITDLASALSDRNGGPDPVHFECAMDMLAQEEKLSEGERIAYIGQGRFGVLSFPNPHDNKHFTIKKIIEWEEKDKKPHWRDTMAELYSRVK